MPSKIDVFISYKREERVHSEHVKRSLIAAGYTAVTDLNIGKNEEFGDAIDTMIRTATLTLVLWTKASALSDWVRKEARLARDLEKAGKQNRYLGVMVEDVDLDLPPDLRGLQMIDIHKSGLDESGTNQLLSAAHDILGSLGQQDVQTAEANSEALAKEWQLYELARSINVAPSYQRYLAHHPDGEFADDARRQLAMFTWYLHPFRRGNMANTLAALGIIGTVAATVWGATRDPVVIGIDPDEHAATVSERNDATIRAETLQDEKSEAEAELVRSQAIADVLRTERDNAIADAKTLTEERDAMKKALDTASSAQAVVQTSIDFTPQKCSTRFGWSGLLITPNRCVNVNTRRIDLKGETSFSNLNFLTNFPYLDELTTPDGKKYDGPAEIRDVINAWAL